MATKPHNTSAFIAQLLAPLPASEGLVDTPAYRQLLRDDAKAADDIRDIISHIEHLRTQTANPSITPLQREMCGIVLACQEEAYTKLRVAA